MDTTRIPHDPVLIKHQPHTVLPLPGVTDDAIYAARVWDLIRADEANRAPVVTAYAAPPTQPVPAPQAPPVHAPAVSAAPSAQSIPSWAKTTALLAPTIGGGIAAAGYGLSAAAPGLAAMSQLLWPIAALAAACPLAGAALIRAVRSRTTEAHPQQITQNIHAGLFGRATGTINHR
ncbi:hypothetical protein EKH77_22110 [Streptomyces luteoverticillatus]|uniref:Uncharacterized protein n=1 Tax=Streptomyces luteoverticillatus TaxID=66425 RepID=A0A3Q9G1P2_STRLT|nr:hypothetical protein [Streptomyces luteoverticillatus]AZQ73551.1 hypothetical protein EKH77_22110 [Streptomyces luteoverticillatus]